MFTATTIEITHTVQITISIEGVTCNTLPLTLVFLFLHLNFSQVCAFEGSI